MKTALFLILFLISQQAFTQDKTLLQKQMVQIMLDYPNKFKNLEKPDEPFVLKFHISGTDGNAMILGENKQAYISAFLGNPESDADAKELFNNWITLINSITLNGATLTSKDCEPGLYGIHCKEWKIDNSKNNIDKTYLPFTIEVSVIKFQNAFAASLKIGDL